ncbi:hypothetical protein F4825DRAFT_452254 [Nemania diffusa]|nr:hypothetical protein F4825DRAFT_452254 [Nemania diffusa]
MAELMSLVDSTIIPSTIDPVYPGSSAPLALAAAGIQAILRRAKSMGHLGDAQHFPKVTIVDQEEDEGQHTRVIPNSPVRANSKCRRSVLPSPGIRIRMGYSSKPGVRADLTPPRSGSVELGSDDRRDSSLRAISRPRTQSISASEQRNPSRGRTRRRDDAPYDTSPTKAKYPQHDRPSNISRRRQHTQVRMALSGQTECPSSTNPDDSVNDASLYVKRGVFRLSHYRGPETFRVPKSRSQTESTWHTGDGFSDDELETNIVLLMAGKQKRKRSGSLSAFGQLSVEAGDVVDNNAARALSSRKHQLHGLRGKMYRAGAKDVWPTRENFTENLKVQKPRDMAVEDHGITQSTPPFNPISRSLSSQKIKQTIPLKRRPSHFENFGRHKRRSHSHHTEDQSSSFTQVQQKRGFQVGAEEYYEADDELYGREEDDSENGRWSVVDEEFGHTSTLAYDLEGSDIGSDILREPDDSDESWLSLALRATRGEVADSDSGEGRRSDAQPRGRYAGPHHSPMMISTT